MLRVFPFTAVVGHAQLKLALQLVVVEQKLGGLLISGPRGSAKSTVVRSLAGLLGDKPLVTLPLGATEEMLSGTLDLKKALVDAEVHFAAGLFARADTGLLYVDEVNLLADHLVDLLLDVAAAGVNYVERDGISHQHAARFCLIGTMNPDEGELRPQLLDRFGLLATLQTEFSLEQRQQVVRARLHFDRDPEGFLQTQQTALRALERRLAWAKAHLHEVELPPALAQQVAELCQANRVDGLRADITLHRAACAHAALRRARLVDSTDLAAVAELVLAHRRHTAANPAQDHGGAASNAPSNGGAPPTGAAGAPSDSSPNSSPGSSIVGNWTPPAGAAAESEWRSDSAAGHGESNPGESSHGESSQGEAGQGESGQGQWQLSDSTDSRVLPAPPRGTPAATKPSGAKHLVQPAHRRAAAGRCPGRHWHRAAGDTAARPRRPDWFGTLADAENLRHWQQCGRRKNLRFRRPRDQRQPLNLVLLDTSASTLQQHALGRAKRAVQALAARSYLHRQQLCIITFGNARVQTLLHPQRPPKQVHARLHALSGGGGTPLAEALQQAALRLPRYASRCDQCSVYLLTDARVSRASLATLPRLVADDFFLVDTESARVKLGLGRALAAHLGARYVHLDQLNPLPSRPPQWPHATARV